MRNECGSDIHFTSIPRSMSSVFGVSLAETIRQEHAWGMSNTGNVPSLMRFLAQMIVQSGGQQVKIRGTISVCAIVCLRYFLSLIIGGGYLSFISVKQ